MLHLRRYTIPAAAVLAVSVAGFAAAQEGGSIDLEPEPSATETQLDEGPSVGAADESPVSELSAASAPSPESEQSPVSELSPASAPSPESELSPVSAPSPASELSPASAPSPASELSPASAVSEESVED